MRRKGNISARAEIKHKGRFKLTVGQILDQFWFITYLL